MLDKTHLKNVLHAMCLRGTTSGQWATKKPYVIQKCIWRGGVRTPPSTSNQKASCIGERGRKAASLPWRMYRRSSCLSKRRFQLDDGVGGLGDEAPFLPGLYLEGSQNPVNVGGRKTRIHRFPGRRNEGVNAHNMSKLYLETCRRRRGKI